PLAWVLVIGAVATSLLTLYAVMRVWTKGFWRSRDDAPEGGLVAARPQVLLDDVGDVALAERNDVGRMPVMMVGATAGLVVVGLALTVFAGPIVGYSERAADNLMDRSVYVGTVLGSNAAAGLPETTGPA